MNHVRLRVLALSAAAMLGACAHAVEVGGQPPAFELPSRNGTVNLAQYKGKTVYLDFWASWCGPCKQSFPWMNDMQSRYGAKGLQVVAVNLDQKADEAKAFLEANPALFEVAFDPTGQVPRSYAIKGMPTSVLIGSDGRVLLVHAGFRDEHRAELEKQIQQALGQKVL
jgi:cytochrome c biogenesis protein CcmG, thiol:disulfide interchange protein DsbE